jgi:quercetin dioxygenase-like cupin family protein
MQVVRASARATRVPPPDNFSGTVYMDEIASPAAPSRLRTAKVTFAPGARTAWHTHPVGQVLYAMFGVGRVQEQGKAPIALYPGDTVLIPPDVKHWHGAAPDSLFAHVAVSELAEDGGGTVWLEKVSDADYAVKPAAG